MEDSERIRKDMAAHKLKKVRQFEKDDLDRLRVLHHSIMLACKHFKQYTIICRLMNSREK